MRLRRVAIEEKWEEELTSQSRAKQPWSLKERRVKELAMRAKLAQAPSVEARAISAEQRARELRQSESSSCVRP